MRRYFPLAALTLVAFVCVPSAVHTQGPKQNYDLQPKFRRSARPVAGQYLVALNDDVVGPRGENSHAAEIADELASVHGGNVVRVFKHAVQGFSVQLPEAAAEAISHDPRVAFVEEDGLFRAAVDQQTLPTNDALWGLDRIDQHDYLDRLYHFRQTDTAVHVYVLDTGIRTTHVQFGDRASVAFDSIGDGQNGQDCNGHGTHVAGIIGGSTYGVAKNVKLHSVRVLRCDGRATDTDGTSVIAGVDWVTSHHENPAVANMSLYGPLNSMLDEAVSRSIGSGVIYVVAAGNTDADFPDPDACHHSPGSVAGAYTVGASTMANARRGDSKYGQCLDMFAPGDQILSAWYQNDYDTAVLGGTSMAAPHVAGVIALELENNPSASPLVLTTPCRLSDIGEGSPNELLFSRNGTDVCTPSTVCQGPNCRHLVGTLGTSDSTSWLSACGAAYYSSPTNGLHQAWLTGPAGSEFDLTLMKYVTPKGMIGGMWIGVAGSDNPGSCETVTYSGTPATYYWRVRSKSGGGNYDLSYIVPQ